MSEEHAEQGRGQMQKGSVQCKCRFVRCVAWVDAGGGRAALAWEEKSEGEHRKWKGVESASARMSGVWRGRRQAHGSGPQGQGGAPEVEVKRKCQFRYVRSTARTET